MAKLYFRYGTMGSAKTLNLLAVAHNYEQQGKKVCLLKPQLDTRFGAQVIRSRAGLEKAANYLISQNTELKPSDFKSFDCILVDECQFLGEDIIDQLRVISIINNTPIICYGLRTDFKSRLFPGSKRLMEISDSIEEIKTTCSYCNRKAIFNLKFKNGVPVNTGPSVELGAEEKYQPSCNHCYYEKLNICHKKENPTQSSIEKRTPIIT